MKIVSGDLIKLAEEGCFDVIFHGCNCFHVMGGGIARQLADKYPQVARADKLSGYGDKNKLGTFSQARVKASNGNIFTVKNVYTQYRPSYGNDVFVYGAFKEFLDLQVDYLSCMTLPKSRPKKRLGFPMIGAGLAGGDWSRILPMIEDFANQVEEYADVTIVEYLPNT
jgi:O-acetyl-ADP-ribose deacetylase (regulator of RNase III)